MTQGLKFSLTGNKWHFEPGTHRFFEVAFVHKHQYTLCVCSYVCMCVCVCVFVCVYVPGN